MSKKSLEPEAVKQVEPSNILLNYQIALNGKTGVKYKELQRVQNRMCLIILRTSCTKSSSVLLAIGWYVFVGAHQEYLKAAVGGASRTSDRHAPLPSTCARVSLLGERSEREAFIISG